MKFHDRLKRRYTGNSLVEYGFIAALILVVSIGALIFIGQAFNKSVQVIKKDMQSTSESAEEANKPSPPPDVASGSSDGKGGSVSGKACSGTNVCMSLPPVVSKAAVTTGANGTSVTADAAKGISKLLQILKSDPNADPSLVALITKLANQGHALAQAQRDIYYSGRNVSRMKSGMSNLQNGLKNFDSLLTQINNQLKKNSSGMTPSMLTVLDRESGTIIGVSENFKLDMPGLSWQYQGSAFNPNKTNLSSNKVCNNGGKPPECIR